MRFQVVFFLCLLNFTVAWGADSEVSNSAVSNSDLKTSGPKISVAETIKDFGTVSKGDVLTHEFIIANIGTQPLIIKQVSPACGCTAAVVNNPIVKPGEETQLRVTFETESFEGVKNKPIRIYTNDPKPSTIIFYVKANILPDIQVTPARIDLGEISRRTPISQKIELISRTSPFNIQEVLTKSDYLRTEFKKVSDTHYTVDIISTKILPLGKNRGRVVIKTTMPKQETINYQTSFFAFGDLSFSPKSLNFGSLSQKNSGTGMFTKQIRIQNLNTSNKTLVNEVLTSLKSVSVSLKQDSLGQLIEISLDPRTRGVIRGVVSANTSSLIEDEKILEFPFFGIIED